MTAALVETQPEVREYPLIFTAESVRGILARTKTQTRRVVRLPKWLWKGDYGGPTGKCWPDLAWGVTPCLKVEVQDGTVHRIRNPWGFASDAHVDTAGQSVRIWARETWEFCGFNPAGDWSLVSIKYLADDTIDPWVAYEPAVYRQPKPGRRPSLFMPRWASRILLEITDVRAERLHAITEADILAEGIWDEAAFDEAEHAHIAGVPGAKPEQHAFATGWDRLNGKRAPWASDPWVWVVSFRVLSPSESP